MDNIDRNDDNALLDGSDGHQSDEGNMNDLLDEPNDHQKDRGDIAVIPGGSEARIVSESDRYFMPLALSKTQDKRVTQTWSCVEKYDVVLNINIRGTVKAFEKYAHCLLTGDDVNIVLGRWRVSSVPRRGMIFHQYCPPLLAFSTDRRLKNGKICPKECLEWVNGRRSGPLNAAAIKVAMYQESHYASVVAALNKQRATLLDINFSMQGCRKLLGDAVVETLKVRPMGVCNNLDFLASLHVKALYWDGNSNTITRGVLTAFPNLAVIVYRDCKFTRSVQLPGSIRIIICCTRRCQCDLGRIRGWQRPYSVKCGPNVIGGPASLYFKTKEDFLCFGDYSGVSRIRHTQDV